jgi:dTDP-glucose pyrophosphorylase
LIVVIPMSGGDEAFRERGYPYSKPLTEIRGRPMIEHVWNRLVPLNADKVVFVIRKDDALKSHLDEVLRLLVNDCLVIYADGVTAGAACTALLAIEAINNEQELIITNGDQIITSDLVSIVDNFRQRKLDAGTIVFDSIHPRWSFVRIGDDGFVTEAAEKRPISRNATAGFYYFRLGKDFVNAARSMIRKDAHVNGAFYVCPVFNELILHGKQISTCSIRREEYISLATPQNVQDYEEQLELLRRPSV